MRNTLRFLMIFCFLSLNANERYSTISEREEELISHVIQSLARADRGESKLSEAILKTEGMSGTKYRHFINNLCSFSGTRYFEVGCWKGSTLISALYGNEAALEDVVACDNFSEFGGPKNELMANIDRLSPHSRLRFFDADCFTLDKKSAFPQPINLYFYDGVHDHKAQELAFTYFDPIFDDVFIAIVDDWNLDAPRRGTAMAFRKLGYKILFQATIDTMRHANGNPDTWWDGLYVAVIRKKQK